MKKFILALLILPLFACSMDERLGGPSDLQYVVLERVDVIPPDADDYSSNNISNVGYVSLSPDRDNSTYIYNYKYTGIKNRLVVRNSTDKTLTYNFTLNDEKGVFFISPARDRKTGEILRNESCFITDDPYITSLDGITLKSKQLCTFDVLAKPNSNSNISRIDFNTKSNDDDEKKDNATQIMRGKQGEHSAILKIKSDSSITEYNLTVNFVETAPVIATVVDNKSKGVTAYKSYVDFGTVKSIVFDGKNDNYICDDASEADGKCLPFAAVITDNLTGDLTFSYSRNFGEAYKISSYSTCSLVKFNKDDEFTEKLDKAYLPCVIFFNFAPKNNTNYQRIFTFDAPGDSLSHSVVLMGNTSKFPSDAVPGISTRDEDNKTTSFDNTTPYVKFKDIDLSNTIKDNGTFEFSADNLTVGRQKIFFKPFFRKDVTIDNNTVENNTPYEIVVYNVYNVDEAKKVVDRGFVVAMMDFVSAITEKFGDNFTIFDNKTTAKFIHTLAGDNNTPSDNNTKPKDWICIPIGNGINVANKTCYTEVGFITNILDNNSCKNGDISCTNDNFTKSHLYTYMLDTSIGKIPLYGKFKSPCDKELPSGISPPDKCVGKKSDNGSIIISDKIINYHKAIDIGTVTDNSTDNETVYRVYVSTAERDSTSTITLELDNVTLDQKIDTSFTLDKDDAPTACSIKETSNKYTLMFNKMPGKNNCSYLIKFEYTGDYPNTDNNDNVSETFFNFVKQTYRGGTAPTTYDTSTYYPIHATVMGSKAEKNPPTYTGRDNNTLIQMNFAPTNFGTYSKDLFVMKIRKPNIQTLSLKFDDNFYEAFKILPKTTCKINYSHAQLTDNDFPKVSANAPAGEGTDYCLLFIAANPPYKNKSQDQVINVATYSSKMYFNTYNIENVYYDNKTYEFKITGYSNPK